MMSQNTDTQNMQTERLSIVDTIWKLVTSILFKILT